MKKRNTKHEKRLRKLIVATVLCTFILGVSTYAWFIGMKTVNVSSFDVSIAAIDSLLLMVRIGMILLKLMKEIIKQLLMLVTQTVGVELLA